MTQKPELSSWGTRSPGCIPSLPGLRSSYGPLPRRRTVRLRSSPLFATAILWRTDPLIDKFAWQLSIGLWVLVVLLTCILRYLDARYLRQVPNGP